MAGETTVDLVSYTDPLMTGKSVGALVAQTYTVALRTTDLALNDITGVCRIPKGATVVLVGLQAADLDSGSEALVFSIYLGTVLFKSGITLAVAKAGAVVYGDAGPITVAADTIVYLKATTAAATAVAGNIIITPIYSTSE
jgi:hypothetical protein